MIQMRTILEVADNSGAKRVQCIKVLGGSRRRYARLGDGIVVGIKETTAGSQGQKGGRGDPGRAVVVGGKKDPARGDGSSLRFDENGPVLTNAQLEPVGSRIF